MEENKLKISVISHNYLNEENYKKIDTLSKNIQLEIISPSTSLEKNDKNTVNDSLSIKSYKKIQFPSSQYLLLSKDFNFKKFKPDVVHIEYDPWNLIFIQTLIFRNIFRRKTPIICTAKQNTYTEYGFLTKIKDAIAKYFVKKVDHVITISQKTASLYKERFNLNSDKITHIGALFGIDTNLFSPATENQKEDYKKKFNLSKNTFVIGYVGKFNKVKGVETLLEAVKKTRKDSGLDLHLALIGNGNLKELLLEESNKNPWLHILPKASRSEVAEFLKTLDLFIMPSHITKYHEEHDAIALLEAMSSALPCIGTNSGIIPEILGDWGIIVNAGDGKELSDTILRLYHNKELRDKLGNLGRERIKNEYSLECIASKHYQVYKKINETK
jgi:L-malate glycosyltransferase